jgi:hypothetical protein
MRILRLAPVQAARSVHEARPLKRSPPGVAALAIAVIVAIVAPAGAQAACEGTCTEEQAATGIANPPEWAEGRTIHFEPETLAASAYTAGELEGEGGPLLFSEAGSVQHTPKVYVIFWGSNFKATEKGIESNTMLQNLFKGLTSSAYQGILTQYFDTTGRISSTATPTFYFDESVKAPEKLNALKVEEEISAAVSANKWTPETSAQFLLSTSPGSTYETTTGCAYHGVTSASGKVTGGIVYDFVPYQGDPPFSTNGCVEIGNPTKNPVFKTSKSASHEYAEAATDPLLNAWRAASGEEIADICQAQNIVELPSGAWVQNQYDNHQNSCSHEDLKPPFAYAITGSASGIKSTEATLNGTVNPESLSSQYYFEYGTTKSYGSKTAEVSAGSGIKKVAASQLVSGLTPSTTYHFRVAEVNSTGTTTGEDRTFTTTPDYAGAVLADSPVSYWRLGEASGTNAGDERGANSGTYKNSPTLGATSLLATDTANTAVSFDGTNDFVQVPSSSGLQLTSSISLEAWIKPTSLPTSGNFVSILTKPDSYSLQFNGPRLEFTIIQSGVRKRLLAAEGAIVAGHTYHVVGTYDGTTQRLYINGNQVASTALSGPATTNTNPLFVGTWNGVEEFFKGTIDEPAVYGSVLSPSRIAAHYEAGSGE